MKLICKHCGLEFEAQVDLDTDPGFDCIWCPECQKLTPVKVADRLWRRKYENCTDVIVDWGDEE